MPIFCFILPTLLPMYIANETALNAWLVGAACRYVLTLHSTWLGNSAPESFEDFSNSRMGYVTLHYDGKLNLY